MTTFIDAVKQDYVRTNNPHATFSILIYSETERGVYWVTKIERVFSLYPEFQYHLCGYVYHKWEGVDPIPNFYDSEELDAHGGITYGHVCKDLKNLNWNKGTIAGFDCAHGGDATNPRCKNKHWVLEEARLLYEQMDEIYQREKNRREE